jgi:hypothetical protein
MLDLLVSHEAEDFQGATPPNRPSVWKEVCFLGTAGGRARDHGRARTFGVMSALLSAVEHEREDEHEYEVC